MTDRSDIQVLRELARRYAAAAQRPVQDERRDLWRRHNSLEKTRPLIYVRGGECWNEVPEITHQECRDPFLRRYERALRHGLYVDSLGDDTVLEPWITVRASFKVAGWGMRIERRYSETAGGSWKHDPPLKDLSDLSGLTEPHHVIDEEATARDASRLQEAVGDLIEVNIDRSPAYQFWSGDISTDLGYLRGIEQVMWDMMDDPAGLHRLCRRMGEGILRTHEEAERAGDWRLSNHQNQAMPYAKELRDPAANGPSVKRKDLWVYMAAQEFTLISAEMHEEFLLRYQLPILREFGLSAYGCCENLTRKIDMLRKIPNLRRIAVTPTADLPRCAEQIGTDYVISWRPNPAEMVCCGWNPDRVRRIVGDAVRLCRDQHMDITLKDAQTIQGDPARLIEWTRLVREIAEGS